MRYALLLLLLATPAAVGQEIKQTIDGLGVSARLVVAEPKKAPIYLIIHGTWAHRDMEIISALQVGLQERGYASLAPSLSLGVHERQGFLPCGPDMQPNHEAAVREIGHWIDFLHSSGWTEIRVLGHSRAGAQVALYQQQNQQHSAAKHVTGLVLLAPMVWRFANVESGYDAAAAIPLRTVLKFAHNRKDQRIGPYRLLGCSDVRAPAATFLSYYGAKVEKHTPTLIENVAIPALVLLGTADEVAAWNDADRAQVQPNANVRVVEIDGAGHFFRDLFLDDALDVMTESY